MSAAQLRPIQSYMPHAGTMCWIDELIAYDDLSIRALAVVSADHPFCDAGAVAPWHGIEFMAQTIAAWAGLHASAQGKPPPLGFLLGTRRFEIEFEQFAVGDRLEIFARQEFSAENGLSAFHCEIHRAGICIAKAMLSVFEPANADEFLRQDS